MIVNIFSSLLTQTYQKEDLDQAAIHLLHFALPPGSLPLSFDDLTNFQEHHGPAGISSDVLLDEVATRGVLYVLPSMFYCENKNTLILLLMYYHENKANN